MRPDVKICLQALDLTHKGRGWALKDGSIASLSGPDTVADGMTAEHAAFLAEAAGEYHGLVRLIAALRRKGSSKALERIEAIAAAEGADACPSEVLA